MSEMVSLRMLVDGRVQGVGFRYFVRDRAAMLGACGWVRNLYDGRVEALAEANCSQLEALLGAIQQGPPSSFVSDVQCTWGKASGEFTDFVIESTV
jgi:acylphosphatase